MELPAHQSHFLPKPCPLTDTEPDPFESCSYSSEDDSQQSRADTTEDCERPSLASSIDDYKLPTLYLPLMDDQEISFSQGLSKGLSQGFSPTAIPSLKDLANNPKEREAFGKANSLFEDLIVVETALSWSAYGFDFTLESTGRLFVERSLKRAVPLSAVLRLHNPNGFLVLAENITIRHLLAKAESVIHEGRTTHIDKMDIWACGRDGEEGEFVNKKGAHLNTDQFTLHEGSFENQGEVSVAAGGSLDLKDHDARNYQTMTFGNGASLVNAKLFRNGLLGIIQGDPKGGSYTLQGKRLENLGQILGTRRLDFQTGENSGLIKAQNMTMVVGTMRGEQFTNRASGRFLIEDRFSTQGKGTFLQEGRLESQRLFLDNNDFIDNSREMHTYTDIETGYNLKTWTQQEGSVVNTKTMTLRGANTRALNEGTLRVAGKLTNFAASFQNKGDIQVKTLEQLGSSLTNEEDATLEVEDDAFFAMESLTNHGLFTLKGKTRGRIDHLLNHNAFILEKEATLTGQTLTNHKVFRAKDIFNWRGETVTNHHILTLFDNQIRARQQVINHHLLLWTHNTFRTQHVLNRGLMARTEDLEGKTQSFKVSPDTSTSYKKAMVENRGVINLKTSYTPRMTVKGKSAFDHWDNSGKLDAQNLRLKAQSFQNTGEVTVTGSVTGQATTFTNQGTMLVGDQVSLTGTTFENTGKVQADKGLTYNGQSLTNRGQLLTPARFQIQLTGTLLNSGHLQADQGIHGKVHRLDQRGDLMGSMSRSDSTLEVETKVTTAKGSHWNMHGLTLKAKEMEHEGDLRLASKSRLEIGTLHNLGIIDRLSGTSAYETLTLVCSSVNNEGFLGFGSLSLATSSLESGKKSKLVADQELSVYVRDCYVHYGLMSARKLTYRGSPYATLINRGGQLISTETTLLQTYFDNEEGGEADLTGLTLEEGRGEAERLILENKGKLILRRLHSLGTGLKEIVNGKKATFVVDNCGYSFGVPEGKEGQELKYGGFAFGKVTNHGTIAFSKGTYHIRGDFLNYGIHEISKGLRLWYHDLINHGEMHSDHDLRMDHTRGRATKIGKVRVKGKLLLQLGAHADAAEVLRNNDIQSEQHVRVESKHFTNKYDLNLPGSWTFETTHFDNQKELKAKGLSVFAGTFKNGLSNDQMGTLESLEPLTIETYGDLDNSFGIIRSRDDTSLKSLEGTIKTGASVPDGEKYPLKSNGSKITVGEGTLTLEAQNINTDFGAVYSKGRTTLKAKQKIRNQSGKIYSSSLILLEADELENLIGDLYAGAPYHRYPRTIYHCVQAVTSEPAEIKSSGGPILFKINKGLNLGSVIETPRSIYYNDTGNTTRPTSFDNHDQPLYECLRRYCHHDGYIGLTDCGDEEWPTGTVFAGSIKGGEIVDIKIGDLRITGSINAPILTVNATNLFGANTSGFHREGLLDAVFVMDLLEVMKANPLILDQVQKGLGYRLDTLGTDTPLPIDIRQAARLPSDSDVPLYRSLKSAGPLFSAEVVRILINTALSQVLGTLNVKGYSGDELIKEFFLAGKEVEDDVKKAGGALTKDTLTKIKKGGLFQKLQQIGEHVYEGLMLAFTPDMVTRYGNDSGAFTGDHIELTATNHLSLQGNAVSSKQETLIKSLQDLYIASLAVREGNNESYRERKVAAILTTQGKQTTYSGGNSVLTGIETYSKDGTTLTAEGVMQDRPLPLHAHQQTQTANKKREDHWVHQSPSQHRSEATFLSIGGVQDQTAPEVGAKHIRFKGHGATAFKEAHDVHTFQETVKEEKSGPVGSKTTITQSAGREETSIGGGKLKSPNPVKIVSETDNVRAVAITAETPEIILEALKGMVSIELGTHHRVYQRAEQSKDLFWQKFSQRFEEHLTYRSSDFTGKVTINAQEKLLEQVAGQTKEWMERLKQDDHDINVILRNELHKVESHTVQGPTAALAAVIALAVTIATAGAGSYLGAAAISATGATGTTALVISVATSAAFTSLCSQTALAVVAEKGNLGKAGKRLANSGTLKNIVMAAAAAGLVKGIGVQFNLGGEASAVPEGASKAAKVAEVSKAQLFSTHLLKEGLNLGVNVGVQSTIGGGRFETLLKSGGIAALANAVGGVCSSKAGDAHYTGEVNAISHKVMHALSGGIQGLIINGEKGITAGILGSLVAETVADVMTPTGGLGQVAAKDRPTYSKERIQLTQDVARLTAATAALLAGMDAQGIAIAISTATIAVENNFAKSAEKAARGEAVDQITEEEGRAIDESGYDSPTGRTAYARKAVREFQRQKEMATPQQREGWKQIGRTEESIYQNAYADKQREVFHDIYQKESRGEPLTETERHIKAVGFSQAPDGARDIGNAVLGGGILRTAKDVVKGAMRGGKPPVMQTEAEKRAAEMAMRKAPKGVVPEAAKVDPRPLLAGEGDVGSDALLNSPGQQPPNRTRQTPE